MTTLALALLMTLDVGNGPIDPGTHYAPPAPKVHHVRRARPTYRMYRAPRVVSFGYCLAYYQAAGFDWDMSLIICNAL